MSDHGQIKVLLFEDAIQPVTPFDHFDFKFDPHLAEHIGNDLPGSAGIGINRRQLYGSLKPVRISGLFQQLFGFWGIIGKFSGQIHVIGG